jgi:hypothetical protein
MTIRFLCILFVIFLIGCSPSTPEEATLSLPTAIGNPHQILLVADKDFMESDLVDSIDTHISSIFMIVPKYENLIDIDVVAPKDFQGYFKQRRHIIFIDALDKQTATAKAIRKVLGPEKIRKATEDKTFRMATEKNKWAKGQQVIYLFAPTTDELPQVIRQFSKNVHKKVYDFDVPLVRANAFAGGLNEGTIGKIETKLNIRMDIPQGYRVLSDKFIDDNTMWLSNTTTKISYNIIIRTMDYNENSKLTEENIIKVRNDIGKAYISTQVKGAYMTTEVQNRPFPIFDRTNINNHYALEARGLYKMVGDYMGGSFISYMVYNSTTNRVVFMDGFIQAPEKEEHREYLLRLEAIMKTLKF